MGTNLKNKLLRSILVRKNLAYIIWLLVVLILGIIYSTNFLCKYLYRDEELPSTLAIMIYFFGLLYAPMYHIAQTGKEDWKKAFMITIGIGIPLFIILLICITSRSGISF